MIVDVRTEQANRESRIVLVDAVWRRRDAQFDFGVVEEFEPVIEERSIDIAIEHLESAGITAFKLMREKLTEFQMRRSASEIMSGETHPAVERAICQFVASGGERGVARVSVD